MVWNYQNADCSFKKNVALFIILFGTLSFHIVQFTPACLTRHRQDCLVVSGGRCELRITVRTADAYTRDTILQCRPNCKVYRVLTVGLYVYIYSLCADEDVLKPLCLALWEVTWSTVLFSPAVATLLPTRRFATVLATCGYGLCLSVN